MACTMPPEDFALGLGRTVCVVFQHGGASSLTSVRLRPGVPVNEVSNILLGEYRGDPTTVRRHITGPVLEIATPEESLNLETRPVQDQQAAVAGQALVRTPVPPLQGNSNSFTLEADSSREARQPPLDREHGFDEAFPMRSKLSGTRVALLISGALSLVVVPGLVLGIATKQIPWGIALSGAIATVVSFFAGLYYYHNK